MRVSICSLFLVAYAGCSSEPAEVTDTSIVDTVPDTSASDVASDAALDSADLEVVATLVDERFLFVGPGGPVSGLEVLASDGNGALIERATTDADGRVTVHGIDYSRGGLTMVWGDATTTCSPIGRRTS